MVKRISSLSPLCL